MESRFSNSLCGDVTAAAKGVLYGFFTPFSHDTYMGETGGSGWERLQGNCVAGVKR